MQINLTNPPHTRLIGGTLHPVVATLSYMPGRQKWNVCGCVVNGIAETKGAEFSSIKQAVCFLFDRGVSFADALESIRQSDPESAAEIEYHARATEIV